MTLLRRILKSYRKVPSKDRRDGPRSTADLRASGGGVDAGGLHLVADIALEFLKIVLEALGQVARGLVIGGLVGPGVAGIEHVGGNVAASLGHIEAEIRFLLHGRLLQRAGQGGPSQRAGVRDLHAAADAVGPAGPA